MKKETKIALIVLPIIFFSNLIIGVFFGVGLEYNFFNTIHHYFGGLFTALFFYGYLNEIISNKNTPTIKKWLIIVSATIFVGVVWEFSEWIGTYYDFKYLRIGDLDDTLLDLVVDAFGALTLLFLLHPIRKRNAKQF